MLIGALPCVMVLGDGLLAAALLGVAVGSLLPGLVFSAMSSSVAAIR